MTVNVMKARGILAAVLCAAMMTVPTAAAAQQPKKGLPLPIVGTVAGGAGTFAGTFTLQRFAVATIGDVQTVTAVGRLTGTLTNAGESTGSVVNRIVALPVTVQQPGTGASDVQIQQQAVCDILHLELGPLDLDLLGLVVHLNLVVLDIDAESGPGNLLGNLLCAVVGLLDNPSGLSQTLNQILGILLG
jgi:hypothetical protein